MTKYRVYLQTVAETVVEVEADSKEEAVDAAYDADMPRLCAHCSGAFGNSPNLSLGDEWSTGDTTLDEAVVEIEG